MRKLPIIAIAVVISGCVAPLPEKTYWLLPVGGTEQEFRQDSDACAQDFQNNTPLFSICLRRRGYRQEFQVSRFFSCKLPIEVSDLEAFLASHQPNTVAFQAEVISERFNPPKEHLATQDIQFKATRWWLGTPRENVFAQGATGTMYDDTDCQGVLDFSVKRGETWLVVGIEKNGIVYPSGPLSGRFPNGIIPLYIERLLRAQEK
jgi:hypothetical protein